MTKNKNYIITISGTPGSGKSTLAKMLADKLQCQRIYVGGTMREIAKAKKITLEELNQQAQVDPKIDTEVDKATAQKAQKLVKTKPLIVEGRTQFYFLPESINLYIKVSLKEGAKRIWKDLQNDVTHAERNEGDYQSLEEMEVKIKQRQKSELIRYQKYYNINHHDESQYDFVVDTTNITPKQGLKKIIDFLKQKGIKA